MTAPKHDDYDLSDEYRQQLYDLSLEHSRAYDKYVITLSSSAIGVSLLLLKDMIGILGEAGEKVEHQPLLICAWIALGVSLAAALSAFKTAANACDRYIAACDEAMSASGGESVPEPKSRWTVVTSVLNWMSWLGFLVGVALLCAFAAINLL